MDGRADRTHGFSLMLEFSFESLVLMFLTIRILLSSGMSISLSWENPNFSLVNRQWLLLYGVFRAAIEVNNGIGGDRTPPRIFCMAYSGCMHVMDLVAFNESTVLCIQY